MLPGFMVKEGNDDFVKLHGYLFTQKLLNLLTKACMLLPSNTQKKEDIVIEAISSSCNLRIISW